MITPTKEHAEKIVELCSFGIPAGLGKPIPGQMCVEAIISNAFGLEHNDKPYGCVLPEIVRAKISLNDCEWSSNEARAKGMVKLGLAQLGSNSIKKEDFLSLLRLKSTQRILPYLIQKHFDNKKDEKLLEYKKKFESLIVLDDELWKEFYHNYNYNYYNYHNYNYNYNYYNYNYNYNYYNYNYNYYNYNFGDEFLLLVADVILQTLIELKSPGCEFLYLADNFKCKTALNDQNPN